MWLKEPCILASTSTFSAWTERKILYFYVPLSSYFISFSPECTQWEYTHLYPTWIIFPMETCKPWWAKHSQYFSQDFIDSRQNWLIMFLLINNDKEYCASEVFFRSWISAFCNSTQQSSMSNQLFLKIYLIVVVELVIHNKPIPFIVICIYMYIFHMN